MKTTARTDRQIEIAILRRRGRDRVDAALMRYLATARRDPAVKTSDWMHAAAFAGL